MADCGLGGLQRDGLGFRSGVWYWLAAQPDQSPEQLLVGCGRGPMEPGRYHARGIVPLGFAGCGLGYAIRAYRRSGFLGRLAPIDRALLGARAHRPHYAHHVARDVHHDQPPGRPWPGTWGCPRLPVLP
ncbi:hypothetical protein SBA6_1150014 [Candidatus Sulfopaludibacter sp. SbA6]|nr:hypothetical protein SBA6_1150014 [Candidatus Sulfopaludibacter sp. SbA6]